MIPMHTTLPEPSYPSHTTVSFIEDFHNWFNQHQSEFPNPRDQWQAIMEKYFDQTDTTHLSKTSKTNFTKYMADKFEATATGTATKLQCQNCKQRFSRHFLLPMYPQPLELCDSNTYLFCWACLQASGQSNYMIHPGPWLNTTPESESADMTPTKDLNQIQDRPWALQSLDSDYGKDFSPFVWIISVQPEAQTPQEGVIQHSWNHQLNRWQRFPLCHISDANRVTRYDITEFQRLTNKVWKLKAANLSRDHHLITRSSTCAQTLHQLRFENPYVEDAELRARALKTLNFISNHAAASFFQIPTERRQQILDTFIQWETNRIKAGLTGLDSSLHEALNSDTDDLFLKQFWTVVLPSLHHHFICRNPNCKKVVMSHHWATTVKHGARKQGHYICPSCLAIYRPFADADYKGKPLLKPKQCLVVKAHGNIQDLDTHAAQPLEHEDRPDVHYFLYLMEWPEETTDQLLNNLKIHTADLLKGYDAAEDRIGFLHDAIRDQLKHAQKLQYMRQEAWPPSHLEELQNRNQQANFELYLVQDLPTFGPANNKIPYYDWCAYKYTEGETEVLAPKQVTKIMALAFCRMMVASHTKELIHHSKRQRTTS